MSLFSPAAFCGLCVLVLSLLNLIGWLWGWPLLLRPFIWSSVQLPWLSLVLGALGLVTVFGARRSSDTHPVPPSFRGKALPPAILSLILLWGLLEVFGVVPPSLDSFLTASGSGLGDPVLEAGSSQAPALFSALLISSSLGFAFLSGRGAKTASLALGSVGVLIPWTILIGQGIGLLLRHTEPYPLAAGPLTGVPAVTAFSLVLLFFGTIAVQGKRGPLAFLAPPNGGARVLRFFLPGGVIASLAVGALIIAGQESGWYGPRFTLTLTLSLMSVLIAGGTLWLGRRLEHLDQQKDRLFKQKKFLAEELEKLSLTDALTRVGNRRAWNLRCSEEMARAIRYQSALSVLILDVDRFKAYNDQFGHQAGDEVLKRLSRILVKNLRTEDFAARYGGEEFAAILPNTDAAGLAKTAERIRAAIEGAKWEKRPITVSIGTAFLEPDSVEAAELFRNADKALYEAKANGRNRVVAYSKPS